MIIDYRPSSGLALRRSQSRTSSPATGGLPPRSNAWSRRGRRLRGWARRWGDGSAPGRLVLVCLHYNEDKDGLVPDDLANDEYACTVESLESFVGVNDFAMRVRVDEGAWTYCDLGPEWWFRFQRWLQR